MKIENTIKLTMAQKNAINYIDRYAKRYTETQSIKEILSFVNIDSDYFFELLKSFKGKLRVAIHFHPDRYTSNNKITIENIYYDGIYKNQFETLISSGGLTAYKGGDRDNWERELFGGAYNKFWISESERPKYGALNVWLNQEGPAPRFGSCYLILKSDCSQMSTFLYGDSVSNPIPKGTYQHFDFILSSLLQEIFHYERALGRKNITFNDFLYHLEEIQKGSSEYIIDAKLNNNLNSYIEAEVHCDINLKNNVDALVVDNSYKSTEIEEWFNKIKEKYAIPIIWKNGYSLRFEDVPCNYRGSDMPELAKIISGSGIINAFIIGKAAKKVVANERYLHEFGETNVVLQKIKYLWHILVRFG
jgi:hypothetical protein